MRRWLPLLPALVLVHLLGCGGSGGGGGAGVASAATVPDLVVAMPSDSKQVDDEVVARTLVVESRGLDRRYRCFVFTRDMGDAVSCFDLGEEP